MSTPSIPSSVNTSTTTLCDRDALEPKSKFDHDAESLLEQRIVAQRKAERLARSESDSTFGFLCGFSHFSGSQYITFVSVLALIPLLLFIWLCICVALEDFPRMLNFSLSATNALLGLAYGFGALSGLGFCWVLTSSALSHRADLTFEYNRRTRYLALLLVAVQCIAGLIILVGLTISPYASIRIAKTIAWPRVCGDSWIDVELTGARGVEPAAQAVFSLVATGEELFTFESQLASPNTTRFSLKMGGNAGAVTASLYSIEYDLDAGIISGTCVGDEAGTGPSCLNGTFTSSDRIAFDLRSNGETIALRGADLHGSFDGAPLLDLFAVDTTSSTPVLHTSMHRCPQMRVCIPSPTNSIDTATLGAHSLVPLGWILHAASQWTTSCARSHLTNGPYTIA